jgi:hypothetical protein
MTDTQSMPANPFIEHPATYRDRRAIAGGDQWLFSFPNGHGASVIRGPHSYGGSSGKWELAVLDATGELDYSTPITSDVLGWLSVDEVREVLRKIAELPAVAAPSPTVHIHAAQQRVLDLAEQAKPC